MSAEIIEATREETTVDVQKRAFMSKFGKYAVAGVGMSVLMAPSASACVGSGICGSVTQYSRKLSNGDIVTGGTWGTDDGSHQGVFAGHGVANGDNYDYVGGFRDFEQGQNYRWSGSMTYAEDKTWSGSGDIFTGDTDVGDWSSSGTGFWGRFTAWWNS